VKKAGTLIFGVSVIMWALTTFPQKTTFERDYETELNQLREQAAGAAGLEHREGLEQEMSRVAQARQGEQLTHTLAARAGRALEPVIRPLGFDWRIGTALIGAFAAKEVFVAQLGIVYSVGEAGEESDALRAKLRQNYTPLAGFCIMLFCLISAPCMATIAVTRRESGSWGWALLQLGGLTVVAYVITLVVYQVGSLLQIGV